MWDSSPHRRRRPGSVDRAAFAGGRRAGGGHLPLSAEPRPARRAAAAGREFSYFPWTGSFKTCPAGVAGLRRRRRRGAGRALSDGPGPPERKKYGLDGDVLWPRFELHIYGRDGASWSDASSGMREICAPRFPPASPTPGDDHEFTLPQAGVDTPAAEPGSPRSPAGSPDTDAAVEGPSSWAARSFRFEDTGIKPSSLWAFCRHGRGHRPGHPHLHPGVRTGFFPWGRFSA